MRVKKFIKEEQAAGWGDACHICGVLIQVRPDRLDLARAGLEALPGVEIHHAEADGRLVVTVEDTDETRAGEVLYQLNSVAGVVSASLVYHHHEHFGDTGEALS